MKKLLLILALLLLPATASAHILKTDGTIGAILHIDPDDAPKPGSPATLYFSFKDTASKFQSAYCICAIEIDQNGQKVASQDLSFLEGTDNANVAFTFPKQAVYQVVVSGRPQPGISFQSFQLTYAVRVEGPGADVSASSQDRLIFYGILFLVIVGTLVALATRFIGKNPKK